MMMSNDILKRITNQIEIADNESRELPDVDMNECDIYKLMKDAILEISSLRKRVEVLQDGYTLTEIGGPKEEYYHNYPTNTILGQLESREDTARHHLDLIMKNKPDRPMTVGKHEAFNHKHIQDLITKADEVLPEASDTIRWLVWHKVLDFQTLTTLFKMFEKETTND